MPSGESGLTAENSSVGINAGLTGRIVYEVMVFLWIRIHMIQFIGAIGGPEAAVHFIVYLSGHPLIIWKNY